MQSLVNASLLILELATKSGLIYILALWIQLLPKFWKWRRSVANEERIRTIYRHWESMGKEGLVVFQDRIAKIWYCSSCHS
jgi:hypothetical protein